MLVFLYFLAVQRCGIDYSVQYRVLIKDNKPKYGDCYDGIARCDAA